MISDPMAQFISNTTSIVYKYSNKTKSVYDLQNFQFRYEL